MSPLLGGKSERAVDDHASQLAQFAVGEIAAKANAPNLALVRVTKLSTQVGWRLSAGCTPAAAGAQQHVAGMLLAIRFWLQAADASAS